ncbi:MAG: nucleoside hydrolase, partial [Treponema sp.]|nr:nucleoside hydrolase [Treponema sp.]
KKILSLMNIKIPVLHGAEHKLKNEKEALCSEGADLIIEEALKDDTRPLYVACLGAITDIASAFLLNEAIANKNLTVIWIGGRDWPCGGWEYNLKNDVLAANVVFKSKINLWQVPRNVYRKMSVSFSELMTRVYPYGRIGKYLTENVISFNNKESSRPAEYRILGDSPSIGLMLYPDAGEWELNAAPEIDEELNYIHSARNREIRVYKTIDTRFILEDLYAKLQLFAAR